MKTKLFLALMILTSFASAKDTLVLNNQLIYTVNVTKVTKNEIEFKTNFGKYCIPAKEISLVKFQNPNNPIYTNFIKQEQQILDGQNPCTAGRNDARSFHGKKGGHIVLGALFGPFAIIGTALSNVTPEKGKYTYASSQNKDLFNNYDYISCYRKQAKSNLIAMEAIGWLVWIIFLS